MIIIDEEESLYEDGGIWPRGDFLGRGGYASVNLAYFQYSPLPVPLRYQQIPPIVAVKSTTTANSESLVYEKSIYDALGDSPFLLRCFGDDATASYSTGQLSHNLFLEYASGGSLSDLIENYYYGSGLPECYVRELTCSILGGICHIHEAGFVHCDIKPNNVLLVKVDESGYVAKIGDFGLAKRDDVANSGAKGTRMYLAPECLEQNIQGKEADIWALGCVVFAMLTGTLRWRDCPDIDELSTDFVSEEAIDFVTRCLTIDPKQRPTAKSLMDHHFYIMSSDVGLLENCNSSDEAEEEANDDTKNQSMLKELEDEDLCAELSKLGFI